MHLRGFFKEEKSLWHVFCSLCAKKKKKSLLGFGDLNEYGNCKDFYWVTIMLICICRDLFIVNDTDKDNNFKQQHFVNFLKKIFFLFSSCR